MTAAPARESGGGGATRTLALETARQEPETRSRTATKIVDHAAREMALHVTTTLSRSWTDLSRVFGRMRDAIAYERLMHATFGWALSPMQRLMPSATWPLVHAQQAGHWGHPPRPTETATGGDIFSMAAAWWRGLATPFTATGSGWRPHAAPANPPAFAFAPMFGAAAMMPAIGFGLFL
ncbi:hypothetical protein [Dichotomicrobium thermohalophilum]|uniref:hypothetical protein n=1 Tax=Dichotomicrobium thermohalophilum TaxID=933063 RepID=UPI0011C218CE|nr:hypothetical protein [Dichotomicrobium thermohalophilum]